MTLTDYDFVFSTRHPSSSSRKIIQHYSEAPRAPIVYSPHAPRPAPTSLFLSLSSFYLYRVRPRIWKTGRHLSHICTVVVLFVPLTCSPGTRLLNVFPHSRYTRSHTRPTIVLTPPHKHLISHPKAIFSPAAGKLSVIC